MTLTDREQPDERPMILYRPMGLAETALVFEGAMHAFPPRLPGQPIFYPVLTAEYATQIARDWNTQGGDYSGYVARFEIPDEFAAGFEIHTVGSGIHREMWVDEPIESRHAGWWVDRHGL